MSSCSRHTWVICLEIIARALRAWQIEVVPIFIYLLTKCLKHMMLCTLVWGWYINRRGYKNHLFSYQKLWWCCGVCSMLISEWARFHQLQVLLSNKLYSYFTLYLCLLVLAGKLLLIYYAQKDLMRSLKGVRFLKLPRLLFRGTSTLTNTTRLVVSYVCDLKEVYVGCEAT